MAGDARGKVEAASTPSSKASFVLCAVYLDEVGPVHVAGGGGDYGVMLPCIPPGCIRHSPRLPLLQGASSCRMRIDLRSEAPWSKSFPLMNSTVHLKVGKKQCILIWATVQHMFTYVYYRDTIFR
jgi:hypothetical protein